MAVRWSTEFRISDIDLTRFGSHNNGTVTPHKSDVIAVSAMDGKLQDTEVAHAARQVARVGLAVVISTVRLQASSGFATRRLLWRVLTASSVICYDHTLAICREAGQCKYSQLPRSIITGQSTPQGCCPCKQCGAILMRVATAVVARRLHPDILALQRTRFVSR
jgi:hypothetical protein